MNESVSVIRVRLTKIIQCSKSEKKSKSDEFSMSDCFQKEKECNYHFLKMI